MKNKTKVKGLMLVIALTLQWQILLAQWQIGNTSRQYY